VVRLALARGAAKAKFTNQSMRRSALLMLLNGRAVAQQIYYLSVGALCETT